MGIRKQLAMGTAALATGVLRRALHRPAATLPGKLALYMDPHIISELSGKIGKGSILVVATNGKTTTTNLLANALESAGQSVICNRTGANMAPGIASALIHGKLSDWGVFETDELWMAHVLPQLKSDYVLLLNLFRDQLDRMGEIDTVQASIVGGLASSPDTVLVYNADDPLCAEIAQKAPNRSIAFGIDEDMKLAQNTVVDAQMCQECQGMLQYDYRQYGQLGAYHCPECGFARPHLDYAVRNVVFERNGLSFDIDTDRATEQVHAPWNSPYMAYNIAATFVASKLFGVPKAALQKAIDTFDPKNGRLEQLVIDGRPVLLNLAKNPTGFNQNLKIVAQEKGPRVAAFFVNDNVADGHDISWIWDIDFEELAQAPDQIVYAGGLRKNDLQVRLKYAGIKARLADDAAQVLRETNDGSARPVFMIANYTALPDVRAQVERMAEHTTNTETRATSPSAQGGR